MAVKFPTSKLLLATIKTTKRSSLRLRVLRMRHRSCSFSFNLARPSPSGSRRSAFIRPSRSSHFTAQKTLHSLISKLCVCNATSLSYPTPHTSDEVRFHSLSKPYTMARAVFQRYHRGSPGGPPLPCFPSLYLKIVWVFAEGKAQNAHTLRFPFDPFQVSLAN